MRSLYYLLIQKPSEIPSPHNNDPLDTSSPLEITVYIILPILIFALYFLWKRKRRK
ncbi:hypothetical protein FHR24_002888 [Wenyingzhuangia heitensis]|uniref:Adenylosuccinate synthetase n=1 Tax=Wenyingzhuangia heitensis TaxID=1487859 RepID=A0ABX0UFT3_9FLAO|nr:adenylosuccinate synthetase [Wenyingzhuangia heitensis]NIJ46401.1 hypothetical protein [Wenyingzhuangia heitensis]